MLESYDLYKLGLFPCLFQELGFMEYGIGFCVAIFLVDFWMAWAWIREILLSLYPFLLFASSWVFYDTSSSVPGSLSFLLGALRFFFVCVYVLIDRWDI